MGESRLLLLKKDSDEKARSKDLKEICKLWISMCHFRTLNKFKVSSVKFIKMVILNIYEYIPNYGYFIHINGSFLYIL